jgi:2-alkenal reductase
VIGVTAAIESPVRANSGVGYVIPASIVQRVVPQLISSGSVVHPYLGISGIGLTPDLAKAMDLGATQRGALVAEVVPDGPADKAGLLGSDRQVTIDGQPINVGGDGSSPLMGRR